MNLLRHEWLKEFPNTGLTPQSPATAQVKSQEGEADLRSQGEKPTIAGPHSAKLQEDQTQSQSQELN